MSATAVDMINPLIAALEELPGGLASTIPRLSPNVTEMELVGKSTTIKMFDGVPALLVDQFDPFPDSLPLLFRGQILTAGQPANPPVMTDLRVRVAFAGAENPALNGEVVVTQPVQADGSFAVAATLLFRAGVARPYRLTSTVTIEEATLAVDNRRVIIDNANLGWFLDLIDDAERLTVVSSKLEFVARVRKTFLTSGDFDAVLTRFASTKALLAMDSVMGKRLRTGHHVRSGGEAITISHVLIGIEGGRLQDPRPRIPVARPDTLVTWAGDLGGALVRHLVATYYRSDPAALTFDQFIAATASRAEAKITASRLLGLRQTAWRRRMDLGWAGR